MYIKKVVIDGFKSYAQRTEVDQFDPQFNAITGLNGSGKSNILDAICFVLGIRNLSQVRANNLQDLVYKNGQAGVIKATVSVSFDNTNKSQSPMGYENYEDITITRQVVIGGRNKYLINGINAQNNRVEDLFRSVQMNVNNPHFIIMQGRITKVLNMKPPEILSMVEEAAGTKLYETKKQTALKTIEKKDAKLKEIDAVLNEEISPTLEKLKEERTAYMEYQRMQRELEHLSQLVVAYKYKNAVDIKSQSNKQTEENENNVELCETRMKENEQRCERIDVEIKDIEQHMSKEMTKRLKTLEEDYKGKLTLETQSASLLDNKRETLKSEEKKFKDLTKSIESHKKLVQSKNKELEDLKLKTGGIIESGERDQQELMDAQKRIQALAAGLSLDEKGEAATLANQLMAATEEISRRKTEIKQAEIKLQHLMPELKKCKTQVRKSDTQYLHDKLQFEQLENELAQLQAELVHLNIEDNLEERLMNEKRTVCNEITNLREKIEDLEARIPQLRFEYRDPDRNFDRSRVKGPVAKLISLRDVQTATAIETCAGDRLNYVVIDTEVTGKQLLQNGELKRRVTFIPLNKISASTLSGEVIRRAKKLVGDQNCDLALSLVNYDGDLESAMKFVFGNTFVCTDMDVAKKVTFNRDVMARSVTLSGELFNPQGTLTGGSSKSTFSLLRSVQQLNEYSHELADRCRRRDACEKHLHNLTKTLETKHRLDQQINTKRREIEAKRSKLEFNDQHQLAEEIKRLENEIADCEQKLKESTELKKKAEQRAAEIEERMQNADQYREKETKEAEKKLAQAKKRVEMSSKSLQDNQQLVDGLRLEVTEIENELVSYEGQVVTCQETIVQLKEQIEKLAEAAQLAKENLQKSEELVNQQKEILRQSNKEIQEKQNERDELVKDSRKLELKVKKLKQDAERLQTETRDAAKMIEEMKYSYPWIAEQEKYFGKPGTQFDFSQYNMQDAARKLHQLKENTEKLHRTINTRAMNLYTEAEKRCHDLMKKKRIVENDKLKIGDVIKGLDEKKKEALEKAWKQVNKDFGSIFATLLPNTSAKLEPPAGQTVLDGLEVRVAFGNVWKDSLAELSGGQRSLIALSLILAMLLFKPAPIYILDEVDAALDVSHTQNIGLMLRTHFRYSQFIVVSLKEGMFTNANVLFRTKFVDGRSTVSRQTQIQARNHHVRNHQQQQRPLPNGNNASSKKEETENHVPGDQSEDEAVPVKHKRAKRKSSESLDVK